VTLALSVSGSDADTELGDALMGAPVQEHTIGDEREKPGAPRREQPKPEAPSQNQKKPENNPETKPEKAAKKAAKLKAPDPLVKTWTEILPDVVKRAQCSAHGQVHAVTTRGHRVAEGAVR
jgi:hypothetical protein